MLGDTEAELIDLSKIKKVPITMWSGYQDPVCYNYQAKITAKEIGERVTYFRSIPWAGHGFFGDTLSAGLYDELRIRLIDPERRYYGPEYS